MDLMNDGSRLGCSCWGSRDGAGWCSCAIALHDKTLSSRAEAQFGKLDERPTLEG